MTTSDAILIKGFLLGKDAPKPIMEAIEAIIAASSETRIEGGRITPHDIELRLPSDTSVMMTNEPSQSEEGSRLPPPMR